MLKQKQEKVVIRLLRQITLLFANSQAWGGFICPSNGDDVLFSSPVFFFTPCTAHWVNNSSRLGMHPFFSAAAVLGRFGLLRTGRFFATHPTSWLNLCLGRLHLYPLFPATSFLMKISTRTLLLPLLLTASGLFTACTDKEKDDAPTPADPTPAFQMSSYFDFVATTPAGGTAHSGYGTGHRPLDITATATLAPQVLALDFVAGSDNAYFEVERAKLSAKWLGTYALRCRNRPTDPVFTSYVYSVRTGGGLSGVIYRFSDTTRELSGDVTITAYDAQRQLVSGTYTVNAPDQDEPGKTLSPASPKCTIILTGTFEHLKVTPRE